MAKSTKDFTIKIGDGDKPKLRRSALADEKTIEEAVDQVATTGAPKSRKKAAAAKPSTKPATKPSANEGAPKSAAKKAKVEDDKELEKLLRNKRLTIDIPFYLHDALREHNFRNRSTTKDIINDYLHGLLKVKDIRKKK
ncbi:hypothetical protein FUA23_11270 [Neolewinella aurantiaca]|uniref:Uncharacterized protein n=1 Tax=Neolewinella aurantiaca TaxID=2602767 RepID=A0A5C7FWM6_9BACT|nr:hypothetical protein [Neolewinella aurantiaca]TXF89318.1 hypothetical protein FUA23_11270 [Neolewinella aurantiaca]